MNNKAYQMIASLIMAILVFALGLGLVLLGMQIQGSLGIIVASAAIIAFLARVFYKGVRLYFEKREGGSHD